MCQKWRMLLEPCRESYWRAVKFTSSGFTIFLMIAFLQSDPTLPEFVKGACLAIAIAIPFSLLTGIILALTVHIYRFFRKYC